MRRSFSNYCASRVGTVPTAAPEAQSHNPNARFANIANIANMIYYIRNIGKEALA